MFTRRRPSLLTLLSFLSVLFTLALSSCHAQAPGDPTPSWLPGATISLTIARAAIETAEGEESLTGFTGTDLADYDAALRGADAALGSLQDHIDHGVTACTLHADATHAVSFFESIARVLSNHGAPIPANIVKGAARLLGVLQSSLPACETSGAETNAALGARLSAAYHRANAELVPPTHPESL